MKKNHFIILVIGVVAGLLFSLGMCMCLLPEWDAFVPGVVLTAIGGISLVTMGIVLYVKNVSYTPLFINWGLIGKISYCVVSVLVLGIGMSMIMVWKLMLWGIIVGIIGVVMLLFLIPLFFGLKK